MCQYLQPTNYYIVIYIILYVCDIIMPTTITLIDYFVLHNVTFLPSTGAIIIININYFKNEKYLYNTYDQTKTIWFKFFNRR